MDFSEVTPEELEALSPKPKSKPAPAPQEPEVVLTNADIPEIPSKEYHVIDPDTGQLVGIIDAPLAFCKGVGCEEARGKRNPMGFINLLNNRKDRRDLWVHQHCFKPTEPWWNGAWHKLVLPVEGVTLPWEQ